MLCALVTNIQRFAIHDGGGIRTTVFFKGCPLACEWCHNPETQSFDNDGEATCYSLEALARVILRDQVFFCDSGGVTISGGEPLAQDIGFLLELLRLLKNKGMHIACDTCGDVPWQHFEAVLPYVDLFLYDIKLATGQLHSEYTGRDNIQIVDNLKKLVQEANVWLRIPVIGGVNDGDEMAKIIALAGGIGPGCRVSLLPYHSMGADKWTKLGKPRPEFYTPADKRIAEIKAQWKQAGFTIE